MRFPTLRTWFAEKPSAATPSERPTSASPDRSNLRVGIPKVLNFWNTHQFWIGFLRALGISSENIILSSDSSEEQLREFGKGRGTVDCCYPVKCISGHYGELLFCKNRKIDILLSPMIYSLPSVLRGHILDSLTCPRVMAAPESIRAGMQKERDLFQENGVVYASPFVSLGDSEEVVCAQLHRSLQAVFNLQPGEVENAVHAGFKALQRFDKTMRQNSRAVLNRCMDANQPCVLVLARPYHMDTGIGHEIEAELQAQGYPILWMQYFPVDEDLMDWLFGEEIRAGKIRSCFDISDVWTSSYSSNTNEILWAAKVAARFPWITCVLRFSSYECGMDQPTYTPTQKILEASGTLFFKFGDLDATKPAGSIKIRMETIAHYVAQKSPEIIQRKLAALPDGFQQRSLPRRISG